MRPVSTPDRTERLRQLDADLLIDVLIASPTTAHAGYMSRAIVKARFAIAAQGPSPRRRTARSRQNLLDNALRHGGSPLHVTVSVAQHNGGATLTVPDDGKG